jgi:hypothetical protein
MPGFKHFKAQTSSSFVITFLTMLVPPEYDLKGWTYDTGKLSQFKAAMLTTTQPAGAQASGCGFLMLRDEFIDNSVDFEWMGSQGEELFRKFQTSVNRLVGDIGCHPTCHFGIVDALVTAESMIEMSMWRERGFPSVIGVTLVRWCWIDVDWN